MSTEICTTLKGGAGYDAPWIVIRTNGADEEAAVAEHDKALQLIREVGAFGAVKAISQEFIKGTPPPTAADVLKAALPEAQDITPARPGPAQPAAAVEQGNPPCETCGKPTTFKSGKHPKSGDWAGYFCESQERSHTKFIGK